MLGVAGCIRRKTCAEWCFTVPGSGGLIADFSTDLVEYTQNLVIVGCRRLQGPANISIESGRVITRAITQRCERLSCPDLFTEPVAQDQSSKDGIYSSPIALEISTARVPRLSVRSVLPLVASASQVMTLHCQLQDPQTRSKAEQNSVPTVTVQTRQKCQKGKRERSGNTSKAKRPAFDKNQLATQSQKSATMQY